MDNETKLPLGICRHCIAALESAMTDINEITEDEEVLSDDKSQFEYISEIIGNCMAVITNMVMREMDEDEFLAEQIELESFDDNDIEESEIPDLLDEEM